MGHLGLVHIAAEPSLSLAQGTLGRLGARLHTMDTELWFPLWDLLGPCVPRPLPVLGPPPLQSGAEEFLNSREHRGPQPPSTLPATDCETGVQDDVAWGLSGGKDM